MTHAAAVAAAVAADVAADVAGTSVAAAMMVAAVAAAVLATAVTHAGTSAAAVILSQPPSRTSSSAAAAGLMRALTPSQHQQHSHWMMWSSSETMGSAIGAALGPVSSLAVVLLPVHQCFWRCVQHSPCLQGKIVPSAVCCNNLLKVRRL